jgi:hypothetical protein
MDELDQDYRNEPETPLFPEDLDLLEARLIEEIGRIRLEVALDLLDPRGPVLLRVKRAETLERQADRYACLAVLYCRLAICRNLTAQPRAPKLAPSNG